MLSAFQVSRRNSWNQLLGIDWLPSSLYVSRYKYKLEAWGIGPEPWFTLFSFSLRNPGSALQRKRPRCSIHPWQAKSLENARFPTQVLRGESGGQPASNPCRFVLGHGNLIYSACYIYSFATNVIVDIEKIRKKKKNLMYLLIKNTLGCIISLPKWKYLLKSYYKRSIYSLERIQSKVFWSMK